MVQQAGSMILCGCLKLLPMVDTLLIGIYTSTWMFDVDIGKNIVNLIISGKSQQLFGVYITPVFEE